jgi:hypothetical protein
VNSPDAAEINRDIPHSGNLLLGRHVRLEPLGPQHIVGLASAAATDPSLALDEHPVGNAAPPADSSRGYSSESIIASASLTEPAGSRIG